MRKININQWRSRNRWNRKDCIMREQRLGSKHKEQRNFHTKIQYYQMIMNNQQNIKNKYISPFQQRDDIKNKLIDRGVEEGKIRSQMEYERQLKRQENVKRQFQTVLSYQMNERQESYKKNQDDKVKTNQYLRNVLLTPAEIERLERDRKLGEMSKYKQDLDKMKNQKYNMSQSQLQNPQYTSKSPLKAERHDLLLNPLPFNIQNPYILRQMQRKNIHLTSNPSYKTISDGNPYSPTKKTIF